MQSCCSCGLSQRRPDAELQIAAAHGMQSFLGDKPAAEVTVQQPNKVPHVGHGCLSQLDVLRPEQWPFGRLGAA